MDETSIQETDLVDGAIYDFYLKEGPKVRRRGVYKKSINSWSGFTVVIGELAGRGFEIDKIDRIVSEFIGMR